MKVYPYIDATTNAPIDPMAHLSLTVKLTRDDLIELLAANAPAFTGREPTDETLINWRDGQQAPDLGPRKVMELIREQILYQGVKTSMYWDEDARVEEVEPRRDWAARQIDRHWGGEFAKHAPPRT